MGLLITLIVGVGAICTFTLSHYKDRLDRYGDDIREDGDYIEGD